MSEQLAWFKSSYSDGEGGNCVEVAAGRPAIHIRDSKSPAGPELAVPQASWDDFVAYARRV
ncbi:DUF397 domain-containing protein [Streptomyces sp. NPDC051569]|uniref:DUF397 domain-containing protein n=1 Tax=Streptomyces sp. NPDC051569 TaxID=3365661 RepID=UPI00379E832E